MRSGRQAQSDQPNEFQRFTDFMKRLVAVPHSEIKAQLDAEKKAKAAKKAASRASSDKG